MTAPLSNISVAQGGHELVMLLSQPLEYKDYRGTTIPGNNILNYLIVNFYFYFCMHIYT